MSIERTPKLALNRNEQDVKQILRERQPFQVKTPTTSSFSKQTKPNSTLKPKGIQILSHGTKSNQHTPNIKTIIPSGSAKRDSIKKHVSKNVEAIPGRLNRLNTPSNVTTPSSRLNHLNSSKIVSSNSKTNRDANQLNPIINGIDYSHIIARKQELGYTGPGYIVVFECDEKYLKGINVPKGFWKLNSYQTENLNDNFKNIGPTTWLTRMDEIKTPSKNLLNFDFNYNAKAATPSNFNNHLNESVETNLCSSENKKSKKHLTWLDNLEAIAESSSSTPQNDLTLKSPIIIENSSKIKVQSEKKRTFRRSYSHNDLQNIILAQEDYDNDVFYDDKTYQVRLNETFELILPQNSRKIISPTQFKLKNLNVIPVYDLNASNSNDSLINSHMSTSLSQSLDNVKINEVSFLSQDINHINAAEAIQPFEQIIKIIQATEIYETNVSNSKIVAVDCSTYLQLLNQINQINKFLEKAKERLVLKKI